MKPVRPVTAVVAGLLVALISGGLLQLMRNSGRAVPQHSWWEVLVVLAACGLLVAGGWRIRDEVRARTKAKKEADAARRAGSDESEIRAAAAAVVQGREAVAPDTARRIVVLSQTAAIGGGILAGWYAGQAVTQLARLSVPSVRSAVLLLGVLVISSAVLSALGFLVQRWCTIPDDER